MNARQAVTLLVATMLFGLVLVRPLSSQTGIIVNNADAQREISVSLSQDLTNSAAGVGSRVAVQYANSVRHLSLPAVPSSLQPLLGQVSDRIIFQYANTDRELRLAATPDALQTLLAQVSDRIIFQYANTNREMGLGYPLIVIGDTTPPQISGVTARSAPGGEAIAWTTDEYATSVIRYGTQPGVHPQIFSDPLYSKQHEVTLTNVTPGVTYYFVVRGVDRSGNAAESGEYPFTSTLSVYLPAILRH